MSRELERHIVSHHGIGWYVLPNGKLVGYARGNTTYEFWIGNPPAPDSQDHALFVAVCEFAVAQGILRPIHVYALT